MVSEKAREWWEGGAEQLAASVYLENMAAQNGSCLSTHFAQIVSLLYIDSETIQTHKYSSLIPNTERRNTKNYMGCGL